MNCSVGNRISTLSCAFSIRIFNRQSLLTHAPSSGGPTNQMANSATRNLTLDQIERMYARQGRREITLKRNL